MIEINTKLQSHEHQKLSLCAVALSKDKNDRRPHLTHIKIEVGTAIGIDGKRAHVAYDVTVPDGFYKVLKQTKTVLWLEKSEDDIEYPDVLEKLPNFEEIDFENCSFLDDGDGNASINYIIKDFNDKQFVNINFLQQLYGYDIDRYHVGDDYVLLRGYNTAAMIMMLRPPA